MAKPELLIAMGTASVPAPKMVLLVFLNSNTKVDREIENNRKTRIFMGKTGKTKICRCFYSVVASFLSFRMMGLWVCQDFG